MNITNPHDNAIVLLYSLTILIVWLIAHYKDKDAVAAAFAVIILFGSAAVALVSIVALVVSALLPTN